MGEGGGRSAPVAESAGWKTNLTADCRRRIVEKLLDAMRKSLPNSGMEVLAGLQQLVMRFEEKVEYLHRISAQLIGMENNSQTCVANCSAGRGPNRCSNTASTTMQSQMQIKNAWKVPIPLVKQYESCQNSSLSASMEEYAQNPSNNPLNEKGDQLSELLHGHKNYLGDKAVSEFGTTGEQLSRAARVSYIL